MTYCIGVMLDKGMIFASDSRTNAGVDNFAKFCKMTVFERRGNRVVVLLSSGNLAGTQAVISVLRQRCADGDAATNLLGARTMFDVVRLVSDATRDIEKRDAGYLEGNSIRFNASFIVGGQIVGEPIRLFRTYAEGNFIEAGTDTPFFQTGETKYGKPILDRVLTQDTPLADATKCVLVSFDSTMRSNLSVGMPIDLICYERDSLEVQWRRRFDEGDPYFTALSDEWGEGVRQRVSPFARAALVTGCHVDTFIITCEHGGNRIPAPYRRLFRGQRALLDSHRGYDPGSLVMSKALASAFAAPLVASTVSRLLIDLNRSIGHPQLFSAVTRAAPAQTRAQIVEQHYRPYRMQVERLIGQAVARGHRVIHISSHSFTAELDGRVRGADVGLLYHPGRRGEAEVCARWKETLAALAPELRVRRNYPYTGKGDGLTSHLRVRFAQCDYVGIELEVNQGIVFAAGRRWMALRRMLIDSLRTACAA